MRNLLAIALVLVCGIAFTATACRTGGVGGMVEGDTYKTEGWLNNDTYQIVTIGVAKKTLTNKWARRASSKRAAILNAHYQVIEKFKGSTIEGAAGMKDFEMTGIAVAQQLKATVKTGTVKRVTWNDNDDCEILYVIRQKGLKKQVSAAQWSK